jgi:hypothetical protein
MSVTTNGVYLVVDDEEFFIGRTGDILRGLVKEEFPGEGMSLQAIIMDIVQDIVSDPVGESRTFTIEVRE